MMIHEAAEDYLEQVLMLLEKKGHARSIDIATERNVSKATVSVSMKKLLIRICCLYAEQTALKGVAGSVFPIL